MRFADLHPILTWSPYTPPEYCHELVFDCPSSPGQKMAVHVSINGIPKPPAIWGLTLPKDPPNFDWNDATIIPSINNAGPNRHGRGVPCTAHVEIIKGDIFFR